MEKRNRVILALDVTSREEALRVVEACGDYIDAVKTNWPLTLAAGPEIITEISRVKAVICDMKIADIPSVNSLIVEQALARGANAVICHGFPGEDSVRACVDTAKGQAFVVTEMSHLFPSSSTGPADSHVSRIAS